MIKSSKEIAIAVFAYNRPSHLRRVLISLENYKIPSAYIFLDGPKNKKDKKKFLYLSIFLNLGILCIFKYFNFFIDSFYLFSLNAC